MFETIFTPHARLLYYISRQQGKDWSVCEDKIQELISNHSWQLQDNLITCFYLTKPNSDDFLETPTWIGRHVIGTGLQNTLSQLDDKNYGSYDLFRGECFKYEFMPVKELCFLEIFDKVSSIYSDNSEKFGQTWSLSWPANDIDANMQLHFFPF
ncbi:MAG: hypothetical protein H6622_09890 [Halobacteriovoraceae bacterium]|nr:hypothetical protein [Halobacteriovoraceae bacterium]